MAGTSSLAISRPDGLDLCFIVNTRNFGALELREAQKSMRLFAADVMPAFAEAASPTRQAAPLAHAR